MSGEVTKILQRIQDGEQQLAAELLPLIYTELRKLARSRMAAELPGQTLQPTALVHEAYLRLVGDQHIAWDSRGHFFAAAAEAMRRIMIERARRRNRIRHGGQLRRTTFDTGAIPAGDGEVDLLDLDNALTELEDKDETMAQVVKLRYFAGLTVEETSAALGLSPRTVNRQWTAARAWLRVSMASAR